MRILGVDTALRCTGFGVLDSDGRRFSTVDCGVIRSPRKAPLSECLRRLAGGIRELVRTYAPAAAAIEGAFYFKNVRTAMVLGSARGAVIAVLSEHDVPIFEYAPRRVKQAVCGYGNADKQQVALLVSRICALDVEEIPRDATDAMALAVCHAQTMVAAQGLYLPDPL